jgi:hypothetical protein
LALSKFFVLEEYDSSAESLRFCAPSRMRFCAGHIVNCHNAVIEGVQPIRSGHLTNLVLESVFRRLSVT